MSCWLAVFVYYNHLQVTITTYSRFFGFCICVIYVLCAQLGLSVTVVFSLFMRCVVLFYDSFAYYISRCPLCSCVKAGPHLAFLRPLSVRFAIFRNRPCAWCRKALFQHVESWRDGWRARLVVSETARCGPALNVKTCERAEHHKCD